MRTAITLSACLGLACGTGKSKVAQDTDRNRNPIVDSGSSDSASPSDTADTGQGTETGSPDTSAPDTAPPDTGPVPCTTAGHSIRGLKLYGSRTECFQSMD